MCSLTACYVMGQFYDDVLTFTLSAVLLAVALALLVFILKNPNSNFWG